MSPSQMISPNDTPVAQTMVDQAMELQTVVETKLDEELQRIRTHMSRYNHEKAKLDAEIAEAARLEVVNARVVVNEAPPIAPVVQPSRITRFQTGDSNKPEMMDLDDTYGMWFINRQKVLAFYRNAAKPDKFLPVDQQVQFFDFLSPQQWRLS